jgi:uncharacterized coiled-coil protein SlyX
MKDRANNELNETIAALHCQIERLENMRQMGMRFAEQEAVLGELEAIVQSSFEGKGA